ncbi:hypothetical protein MUN82_01000 [Hymenobacter aerilatus]|uniref:Tetratricopeptide repeat protein n=1 Tax=Hymenobacter aerilatus TaxID=2932251 RepID=A0A8T9SWA6_9BACT|nr:hypothetical protein [Hymenobacter aerilatus]UOR05691.1 hypothetical protein MUN82_01000 [Hymenobacter aerilatus]
MPTSAPSVPLHRWSPWLLGPALLAVLAVGLALFHYFTGAQYTLPLQPVTQLKPLPLTLDTVRVGLAGLPVRANAYLLTQTHDVAGPFVRPTAALVFLAVLAGSLVYFLSTITSLSRPVFVAGMASVFFLLMSLSPDLLGVFDAQRQYFLVIALVTLGLPAYAFHAFWPDVPRWQRLAAFAVLVAGLSALLFTRSSYPTDITALQLATYATRGGAVAVALVVLWLGFENVHGLLWVGTLSEQPRYRLGRLPLLALSILYLTLLFLYYWRNGTVQLTATFRLDPLVFLPPAALVGWLGLRRRAPTYNEWLPYATGMAPLYLTLLAIAAATLGYALATLNDPLLEAARQFTALAFLGCGGGFLLYLIFNFGPLIKQRLPVYRVVYQPRRLPFYVVYIMGLGLLLITGLRTHFFVLDQVEAGFYNNLGDVTRLQSEQQPEVTPIALLAERYYAESDVLDRFNHKASWGRAALYRFRFQRQNEINALRRALSRAPSPRLSLRLAALYNEPADFFDRQQALREGLRAAPDDALLASDMAQLYSRSTLTDSVDYYLNRAEAAAPANEAIRTNRLAFLIQQQDLAAAREWSANHAATNEQPALQSNELLLARLAQQPAPTVPQPEVNQGLSLPTFARLYHLALAHATARDTSLLSTLRQLHQQPIDSAYHEQLTFLLALTQHYGGRLAAAQTTLQPLTLGTNASAAYYQNLMGTWLLQQQLYTRAENLFTSALVHGYPEARVGRAYAFALNGEPEWGRTALPAPDSLDYAGRLLRQVLTLSYPTDYATAPDSVKAHFLVVQGSTLPPAQWLPAAVALPASVRPVALLAQLPRALEVGQVASVRQIVEQAAPPPATKSRLASRWNVVRGKLYLAEQRWDELQQLVSTGYFSVTDRPKYLTYQALLAAHVQSTTADKPFTVLLREAPFEPEAILAAADFYTNQQKYQQAYDALVRGLEYAPNSTQLLRAYVLATLPVGLSTYATDPLNQLRALLSPPEYATFLAQYEARRAALTTATESWN